MQPADQNKKIHTKKLLREYAANQEIYDDFSTSVRRLLLLFLKSENISVQSIIHRAKDVYSLKQKIKRKALNGRVYQNLGDIHDLAGVRIILYYKSDIPKVIKIINQEFCVEHIDDYSNKDASDYLDKKSGYKSTHVIVSINKERQSLKEYAHFKGLKCEIQIRTILQNAWAEIEYGIGYKPVINTKDSVNKDIRKILKSAAKKLESIDDSFMKVHDLHSTLMSKYAKRLKKHELNFPINHESLESYLLKKFSNQPILEAKKNLLINQYLKLAEEAHLSTIEELDKLVTEKEKNNPY